MKGNSFRKRKTREKKMIDELRGVKKKDEKKLRV